MRPSIMALVSTRMLPLREPRPPPPLLGLANAGIMADTSWLRLLPTHRPNMPKQALTILGTPQPSQPSNPYRGIDTKDATIRPISNPMVPLTKVAPEMELI